MSILIFSCFYQLFIRVIRFQCPIKTKIYSIAYEKYIYFIRNLMPHKSNRNSLLFVSHLFSKYLRFEYLFEEIDILIQVSLLVFFSHCKNNFLSDLSLFFCAVNCPSIDSKCIQYLQYVLSINSNNIITYFCVLYNWYDL